MKRVPVILVVSLLLTVTALAQMPTAPQFSADMAMTAPREPGTKGKMYFGGGRMRMDMTSEGGKVSIITDPAKKTSYMVMHDQRMYMEMGADARAMGPMGRGPKMPDVKPMSDHPCAGEAGVTCKLVGTELMNGRMCDKWEFVSANKAQSGTTWIDQKLKWPIKSLRGDGSVMEFTNFKEGPQDPSLFAPPSGYEKFDMGAMMRRQ